MNLREGGSGGEPSIRVLLIDGENNSAEELKALLQTFDQSFKVDIISTPDLVPNLLEEHDYDCLIIDDNSTKTETLRLSKNVRGTADVPMILLTDQAHEYSATEDADWGRNIHIHQRNDPNCYELLGSHVWRVVNDWWSSRKRDTMLRVLQVLNQRRKLDSILNEIVKIIMGYTGIEAVGIRLQEGDDYPYYAFEGFPDDHILMENSLCAYDPEGQPYRDEMGRPILECMCGNILRGRFDPSKPFFSEGGSFWTNSTQDLLTTTTAEDRLTKTRNICHIEGYRSVALIPIRYSYETIGLLQLNDRRTDRFTPSMIRFMEELAESIGAVLMSAMRERQVKETAEHYRAIFESVADPVLLIDIDDFTLLQSNEAARHWALLLNVSPEVDTCHGIVAGRNVPCELFGEECSILRMLESQEKTTMVYRRNHGLGNHFIEETANPVRDSEGEIVRAVLVVRDFTKRLVSRHQLDFFLEPI